MTASIQKPFTSSSQKTNSDEAKPIAAQVKAVGTVTLRKH
jgi:hypothetical protein